MHYTLLHSHTKRSACRLCGQTQRNYFASTSVSSASHARAAPTYALAAILAVPKRGLNFVSSTLIICMHVDREQSGTAWEGGNSYCLPECRAATAHQCIAGHDGPPELAGIDAAEEEVLLGCLVLWVHHDDAAQLRHGLNLQHACAHALP